MSTPTQQNQCLIIYQACTENPQPIYVYIGNYLNTPLGYSLFVTADYFITIDSPGFSGVYYTGGFCNQSILIQPPCAECVYNPNGGLPWETINVLIEKEPEETCYGFNCVILENCENNSEQLIAPPSFAAYIGSTIKIEGSDKCWQVLSNNGSCYGIEYITSTSVCSDCIDCLPQVEPEIPRVIPQYFEDFTQTIEGQCEVDTNVKFANAYWEIFKSLKHGMESSCQTIDTDRITVKKKEIDIAKLYDATACVIPTPTPEPEVCIEPTGIPLPVPTPQTLWTYSTIAIKNCCVGDGSCNSNCASFEDNAPNYAFNFTLEAPLVGGDLPMVVLHEGCCLKITYAFGPLENLPTVDFTHSSINFNQSSCTVCQS